jgi:hypothetical protein
VLDKSEFRNEVRKFIDEQLAQATKKSLKDLYTKLVFFLDALGKSTVSQITVPGKPNLDHIKSTGETAFQRAIFNSHESILATGRVIRWLDLELPVFVYACKNKRASRRIDLVGILDSRPIICELKFARIKSKGKPTEPPIYAILELLTYYCSILYNNENLDDTVHHSIDGRKSDFIWRNIVQKDAEVVVCANKCYWDRCSHDNLHELVARLNRQLDVQIMLFETDNFDFEQQIGTSTGYKPYVTNKKWHPVCN